MNNTVSSQISIGNKVEFTQQINELLKEDPSIEDRLAFLSREEHYENLDDILNKKENEAFYSVYLDLTELKTSFPHLYEKLYKTPSKEFASWNPACQAVLSIHLRAREYLLEPGAYVKEFVTVRFINDPVTSPTFPKYKKNCGKLYQVKGSVFSVSDKKYYQAHKEYICSNRKCQQIIVCHSNYNKYHTFSPPYNCPECDGSLIARPDVPFKKYAHMIQEIVIEEESENTQKRKLQKITVEDDLVDTLELGDGIFVVGTLENRQKFVYEGMEMTNEFVLKANSIRQIENKVSVLTPEDKCIVEDDWFNLLNENGEFGARDYLVASFDPDLYGMSLPKFLVLVSLASCAQNEEKRAHSHILFCGAAGVAKSHLLIKAAKLTPKGMFAACSRVSTAGLTVGVHSVDGEPVYEIGALPQCDGGVCCLDEFNQMSDNDMAALHEAMEQQTISITKGGIVAKLRSRCVVMGACNPKNMKDFKKNDDESPIVFGIKPALLSRFDVIFVLRDYKNEDFHVAIARQVGMKKFRPTHTGLMSFEMLKKHLMASREVKPQVRKNADIILKRYYKFIYSDKSIDSSRTTVRCLHALTRLCKAYARLLLKTEVTELDAVVVIRLIMENSYSMGRFSESWNLVEKPLPLGPTENECHQLLGLLGLNEFMPVISKQLKAAHRPPEPSTLTKASSYVNSQPAKSKGPTKWDAALKLIQENRANRPLTNIPVATQRPSLPSNLNALRSTAVSSTSSSFFEGIQKKAICSTQMNEVEVGFQSSLISTPLSFTPGDTIADDNSLDAFLSDLGDILNIETVPVEPKFQTDLVSTNDEADDFFKELEKELQLDLNKSKPEIPDTTPMEVEMEETKSKPVQNSLKDFVNQFSFSQYSKKKKDPNFVCIDEGPLTKRPKLTNHPSVPKPHKSKKPVKQMVSVPIDDLTNIQFENIVEGLRDGMEGLPSNNHAHDSIDKSRSSDGYNGTMNSKVDITMLEGLIDESFFEDDL